MQHVALACGYIAAAVKPGLPVARSTNRRSGAKATAADHDLTEAVVGNPMGDCAKVDVSRITIHP